MSYCQGTAALLFMPHPGSLLLPFSKICQAFFDADPFPVKVRFLLFQGSRLQNLTPPAFSCFLLKRKCCFASFFHPPPLPPHLLWDKSGTVATWFCFCQPSLDFKEWKFLKKTERKKEAPSHFVTQALIYKHTQANALTNKPTLIFASYSNAPPLSNQSWRCMLTCDPKVKGSHGASARRLFVIGENSSLYAGRVWFSQYKLLNKHLKKGQTSPLHNKEKQARTQIHIF